MANLYGVANNIGIPFATGLIGGANVVCPANAETNIADSGLIVAPSNGYFVPMWMGTVIVTFGATVPTQWTMAARIGAGSDWQQITVPTQLYIASGATMCSFCFAGPSSQTAWQPPGSHCFLTSSVTGQPITAIQANSAVFFWLVRGPDT